MAAADAAASSQHYPKGCLYVVATPIGNLADIGLRALHVLGLVDAIACEDTRHTQALLQAYGIHGKPLLAVHEHNEAEAAVTLVLRLAAGERIAYVSDAGTPGVSDPGARLVSAVQAAGQRAMPLPGASSITALLSVAGIVAGAGAFVFEGFLSPKATERDQQLQRLASETRAVVLLESPHRIEALAKALAVLGERPVTLGRELTKQFEQIVTLPARQVADWLAQDAQHRRGEFALVLHPLNETAPAGGGDAPRVLRLLLAELPLKSAVKLASEITGEPRNALYEQALQMKQAAGD